MAYQMKTESESRQIYQKCAEHYYASAVESNQRDYLAAHKYALFLEYHKNSGANIDIKKIESLYFTCLNEFPLYSSGLFDYGKFLFTRCSLYREGLEFMSFGRIECDFSDSYKNQISRFLAYCEEKQINIDKSSYLHW